MFKCKQCNTTEFNLVLHPDYDGLVEVRNNAHQEVEIVINGQTFVADLMFMNQFAVCTHCAGIKLWEYHFPNQQKKTSGDSGPKVSLEEATA